LDEKAVPVLFFLVVLWMNSSALGLI